MSVRLFRQGSGNKSMNKEVDLKMKNLSLVLNVWGFLAGDRRTGLAILAGMLTNLKIRRQI